ncbi:MAG: Protein involved in biosynthesis of mitomycin antibiotics/polyketide fumonisin [Ilumatobacteraceae bacterium]|nr:Protein involved in biosynthesis of mitomycin antibiotics/polyketide fumonisin [Ilumatobacteraceae bacterium]
MSATETRVTTRTFHDDELEQRFLRDGYVVIDFADPATIDALLRAYEDLDSGIEEGYYPSLMSPDLDYKAKTHAQVRDLVWPHLTQVIEGYEPLLGVFMVKHPGPDTEVPPHQDWIVADESLRPTMNVWMPLAEITPEMGQMRVLPGSHRWLEGLRGSPSFPTQWEGVYQQVRDDLMEPVDIKVGQAMVYDIRVLHGTPANVSDQTRVVTSLYAIPENTAPIHYYRSPEGVVEGYEVANNFCTVFNIGDVPSGSKFTEIADYGVEALSFAEISERHARDRRVFGSDS